MTFSQHRKQRSKRSMSARQLEKDQWAHANGIWLSIVDWNQFYVNADISEMGKDLRALFKYDLGQGRDLSITMDALQKQKYSKPFDNVRLLLQACVAEWSEEYSGPHFTRVQAKTFATQWNYMLTAPGWESVRELPNMLELLQSSLVTMRVLSQDKNINQESFQQWVKDTMELAPVEWQEVRQFAFSLWQGMTPEDKIKLDRNWAVHYDICPDALAFLSYVHAESTSVSKQSTLSSNVLVPTLPGP